MRFTHSLLATAVALLSSAMQAQAFDAPAKAVFAHFIVSASLPRKMIDYQEDLLK
jgi:hypothetical protein